MRGATAGRGGGKKNKVADGVVGREGVGAVEDGGFWFLVHELLICFGFVFFLTQPNWFEPIPWNESYLLACEMARKRPPIMVITHFRIQMSPNVECVLLLLGTLDLYYSRL